MHLSLSHSLAALLAPPFVSAASKLAYCALENTVSSFSAVTDIYQSNGACRGTCKSYAFGILQGKRCWCSNVAPSSRSSTQASDCDTGCPGFPSDSCGSASRGVYAYIAISGNSPTTTEAGSGSGTSTSSSTSTSEHVVQTTSNGHVMTVTVGATSSTAAASSSSSDGSGGSSLSGGSTAGIVIGVLGGLALIGVLIFLIFFYRKRARAADPTPDQDMTDNRTSMGPSFMPARGNGRPQNRFTDNRLRTDTVLHPKGRRNSSVSLQDNEDYSRPVLRLTNPD